MGGGYPDSGRRTHLRTTVSDVSARTRAELRRVLRWPLLRRVLAGPQLAGLEIEDALRVAAELVAVGSPVALEHLPGAQEDVAGELADVVARVHAAGLPSACELVLPVGRLGTAGARALAETAGTAGLSVALDGPAAAVAPVAAGLPHARVVVLAGEPDAEERCRALAGARVRLVAGHGAATDLSFVRCLNVLMAGSGHPSVAVTDPRLIAITGERAAWNGRTPDSWEHLMPFRVRTEDQQALAAAGYTVRVAVVSGAGALGRHS
jgi:proline dehydrogenase